MPYSVSSAALCAPSVDAAASILDPNKGVGVTLRAAFAGSLGYNASRAYVSGLVVCDGTFMSSAQ